MLLLEADTTQSLRPRSKCWEGAVSGSGDVVLGGHSPRWLTQASPPARPGVRRHVAALVVFFLSFAPSGRGRPAAQAADALASPELVAPGTVLYLRLETPVSTTRSHLREAVRARVIREVSARPGTRKVAIPLGSVVLGIIEKLIPTSSPTHRARMRLKFTHLQLPEGPKVALAGHLVEVENARETVLPDGTIRGLLASELPLSHLEHALEQLKKSRPEVGTEVQEAGEKALGKADTSIDMPAGTDLQWVLDKPLELDRMFLPAVGDQISPGIARALDGLLQGAPQRASSKDGKPGDPLNLVVIGDAEGIRRAFRDAGWTQAEKMTGKSMWETVRAVIANKGYTEAPVSQLYLYNRPEDLAFQKMFNTFAERHHLRFWRSPAATAEGREVWLGAATHDTGWDIRPGEGVASHAIDPKIDREREKVGADLVVTGQVTALQLLNRPDALSEGLTATGAPWKTDGRLLAIELKLR